MRIFCRLLAASLLGSYSFGTALPALAQEPAVLELPAAKPQPPAYIEIPPSPELQSPLGEQEGYFEVAPSAEERGILDDASFVEIRPSPELGLPLKEADFPEVAVDRISDRMRDARILYRDMETGEFDDEEMAEIEPHNVPGLQLPPPTVIEAGEPAAPVVNLIPAQRVLEPELSNESRIFQQLHGQELAKPKESASARLRRVLQSDSGNEATSSASADQPVPLQIIDR